MEEEIKTIKKDIDGVKGDIKDVKIKVCQLEKEHFNIKLLQQQVDIIDGNVKEIKGDLKEMSKDKGAKAWQFIFYIITLILGTAVGFLVKGV